MKRLLLASVLLLAGCVEEVPGTLPKPNVEVSQPVRLSGRFGDGLQVLRLKEAGKEYIVLIYDGDNGKCAMVKLDELQFKAEKAEARHE